MTLGLLGASEAVARTLGVVESEAHPDPVPPAAHPSIVPVPVWEADTVGLLEAVPPPPPKNVAVCVAEGVERGPVGEELPEALKLGAAPVGEEVEEGEALASGVPPPPIGVAVDPGGVTVKE